MYNFATMMETPIRKFVSNEKKTIYLKEFISSDINTDIHISTSSNIPIEILNNRNFEKELVSEFQDKFINFMMFDEINEDYSVSIELELLNYFNKNSYVTGQWFSNLFRDF